MKIKSYNDFCLFLNVSRETYEKLIIFHKTLVKWQNSINLISKKSAENVWERHFLDSAQLYKITREIDGNIIDFGSGAGFPGLILAMMGNKNIHLVESNQKKCTFLIMGEIGWVITLHHANSILLKKRVVFLDILINMPKMLLIQNLDL